MSQSSFTRFFLGTRSSNNLFSGRWTPVNHLMHWALVHVQLSPTAVWEADVLTSVKLHLWVWLRLITDVYWGWWWTAGPQPLRSEELMLTFSTPWCCWAVAMAKKTLSVHFVLPLESWTDQTCRTLWSGPLDHIVNINTNNLTSCLVSCHVWYTKWRVSALWRLQRSLQLQWTMTRGQSWDTSHGLSSGSLCPVEATEGFCPEGGAKAKMRLESYQSYTVIFQWEGEIREKKLNKKAFIWNISPKKKRQTSLDRDKTAEDYFQSAVLLRVQDDDGSFLTHLESGWDGSVEK